MIERFPKSANVSPVAVATALAIVPLAGLVWNLSKQGTAPLIVAGAAAAAIALVLVHRPFAALSIALILRILPDQMRIEPMYALAIYASVLLALAAWLLDTLVRHRTVQWDRVFTITIAYICWSAVSLLWANDPVMGARWVGTYAIGLLLLVMIVNQVEKLEQLDVFMKILATIGWINLIGGATTAIATGESVSNSLRMLGANENQFGMYLILMMPAVIWPALRSQGTRRTVHLALSVIYIVGMLAMVALSGSRGGAVSTLLAIAALWFWKPVRPWGIAGLVIILAMLSAAPFMLDTLAHRLFEEDTQPLGGRLLLWQASLALLGDHLWTGVGAGNGPQALHAYIASLTSYYNHRTDLPGHNPLLEVGIQTGVLGLLIYVAIPAFALFRFLKARHRPMMREGAMAAYVPLVLASVIGYGFSWLKSGGMENDPSFFVLLALLLLPAHMSAKFRASADQAAPRSHHAEGAKC